MGLFANLFTTILSVFFKGKVDKKWLPVAGAAGAAADVAVEAFLL